MGETGAGFSDRAAAARLLESAGTLYESTDGLRRACLASADADRALATTLDIAQGLAARTRGRRAPWRSRAWLEAVATLSGASRALGAALRRQPRLSEVLLASSFLDRNKPLHHARSELERRIRCLDPADADTPRRLGRILRRYRRAELARIALRDLTGRARLVEVMAELSQLAEVVFEAALGPLYRRLVHLHGRPPLGESADPTSISPGFAVIAMGKLGGRELNVSSDVDVVYVYSVDGETRGGTRGTSTAFEFHARLAESVTRCLAEVTEYGLVFRVDLGLRPEGRSGPVVNSLRATETYYETFGRAWERQALLKARPLAGDRTVGAAALESIRPFVYPRSLDMEAVRSIVGLKDELDRATTRRGGTEADLKLGRGGIRTVEFIVQSLQLMHAGKDARLRSAATLDALERLLFAGLIDEADARNLSEAYTFLRRAEHRVQILDDRQTHRVPSDAAQLEALARSMGDLEPGAAARFEVLLESHRTRVAEAAERRFGRAEAPAVGTTAILDALADALSDGERESRLASLGFDRPTEAAAHLRRLARRPFSVFGRASGEETRALGVTLLSECLRTPDADQALRHLAAFLEALPPLAIDGYHRVLAESSAARGLLLSLFGSSEFLARDFVRHPELLDVLILSGQAPTSRSVSDLEVELEARLHRIDPDDVELQLAELRRFRQQEVLRIGVNDVAGAIDIDSVSEQLSAVAEVVVRGAVSMAGRWARQRWGWPIDEDGSEVPLAVVALGKLGGEEMGYGSDLDLIFLFGGAGTASGGRRPSVEAQELFSRLAQRLISYLTLPLAEGTLYAIDTRLRPSGRQGSLVTRVDAFEEYHRGPAQTWERQALIRARVVSAPEDFTSRVEQALSSATFEPRDRPEGSLAADVRQMRRQLEEQLEHDGGGPFHPKLGPGGLVDIEFVVQFLQLRDGASDPSLRVRSTAQALDALERAGRLGPHEAAALRDGLRFLKRLENRLRIVQDRAPGPLPAPGRYLDALARRMGYHTSEATAGGAGAVLLEDYRRITDSVRATYDRLLGDTEE